MKAVTCRSLILLVLACGCRAGFDSDAQDPVNKVSPSTLSTDAAWALFDRSIGTGFVPGTEPLRAKLDRAEQISALKAHGPANYRLRVTGVDGASIGFSTIDLSTLRAGWKAFPSSALVATDTIELHFEAIGAPTKIPELEIWAVDTDAATGTVDFTTDELPLGFAALVPTSKSADLTPTDCATFQLDLKRSPAVFKRAHLVYEAEGLFRTFALQRSINGLASYGGSWLAGDGSKRSFVDEIDPSVLHLGSNEIRLCLPGNATRGVAITNLHIVGELDRGINLVADATVELQGQVATALLDRDPTTSIAVAAGDRLVLAFERLISPDALVLSGRAVDNAVGRIDCADRQGEPVAITARPRVTSSDLVIELDGGAQRCAELAVTMAAATTLSSVDVIGSGAAASVDWPRIIVTSPSEHFGAVAWIGGFTARPPTMTTAIRVDVAGQPADAMTGDFGRLLGPRSDVAADWPVSVTSRFPDGTVQAKQLLLDRDARAQQLKPPPDVPITSLRKVPSAESLFGREGGSVVGHATKLESTAIRLGTRVGADVPIGAVARPTSITIKHLGEGELPPLDPGMINVTAPRNRGYEFLPHNQRFSKHVEVTVPYDAALLPEGMTPEDVHTYYFDTAAKRWKQLERSAIDVGERIIRSRTDHFTIMIDAVLTVPKAAGPLSLDPTAMTSIAAASPAANITLIEPPQANPTGDARLSYPLTVPSARGAYQPAPAITYSSASGNSWVGVGFDLQLSRIEIDTRFGVPTYGSREPRYALDGAQLVSTTDTDGPTCTSGGPGKRYHTRIEGAFNHILRCGDGATTYHWEVRDRNGTLYVYGKGGNSAVNSPTENFKGTPGIFRWHLANVVDVHGNRTVFDYTREQITDEGEPWVEVYPKSIEYTLHDNITTPQYKIEFTLDRISRPDRIVSGRAGFKMVTRHLLRVIQVSFAGAPIRTYVLTYSHGQFGKSLLSKLSVFGTGDCSPSLSAFAPPGCTATLFNEHVFEYFEEVENAHFADPTTWAVDGDPDPASGVLHKGRSLTAASTSGVTVGFEADGFQASATGSMTWSLGDRKELQGTYDINGDHLPDLVYATDSGVLVLYNQGATTPPRRPLFSTRGPTVEGLSDMGVEEHLSFGVDQSAKAGADWIGVTADGNYTQSVTRGSRFFEDIDGDGFVDVLDADGTSHFGGPCLVTPLGHCFFDRPYGAVKGFDPREDPQLQSISAANKERLVMVDPVVRWVAPFSGHVEVTATARRMRAGTTDGSVGVDLYHQDQNEAGIDLGANATDAVTFADKLEFDVTAGEALYLRVRTGTDENIDLDGTLRDEVDARLHVEYASTCVAASCASTAGKRTTAREPTGELVYVFDSHEDYRIAGRPMPVVIPIEGVIEVHGLLAKRKSAADMRVCLEVWAPGTTLNQLDGNCRDNSPLVHTYFTMLLPHDSTRAEPIDVTNIPVHAGNLVVLRVAPEPVALTVDPRDISLAQSLVGLPQLSFSGVCVPDDSARGCTPDHRAESIALFPIDISSFGTFVVVPPPPELALHQERNPAEPFVVPDDGTLTVLPFTCDGTFFVRSNLKGLVARRVPTFLGCCGSGCAFGGQPWSVAVEKGESISFEMVGWRDPTLPRPATIELTFNNNPEDAPLIQRDDPVFDQLPSPFMGGHRGFQYTLWNEPVAFEPTRLVEDYRLAEIRDDTRRLEMAVSAFIPTARFTGEGPFLNGAWYGRGSIAFATAESQHSALLGSFTTPGSSTEGGVFATNYARMSCSTSFSLSAGGYVNVQSVFGTSFSIGVTSTQTNTTTDVLDLTGDGIADVVASKKTILGALTAEVLGDGVRENPELGDGFRRRDGRDYSIGFGGKGAIRPQTTAGGRRLQEISDRDAETDSGLSYNVGIGLGRSQTTQDLIDVNGDGLPDIVERDVSLVPLPPRSEIYVRYNLGYRFGDRELFGTVAQALVNESDGFEAKELSSSAVDLNTTSKALSHESTVTAHQTFGAGNAVIRASLTLRSSSTRTTKQVADLNGDGLPDLLARVDNGQCDRPIRVQFNLGGSFASAVDWEAPCWGRAGEPNPLAILYPPAITSLMIELALTGPDALASTGTQEGWSFSSSGNIPILPWLSIDVGGSASLDVDTYELALLDIDGDGDLDHVLRRKTGDDPTQVYIKRNELTGQANLLKTVRGPLGGTISLEYNRAGNTVDMPQSRHVMSRVVVDDGVDLGADFASPPIGTAISYVGGFYDRREKEFFGFRSVKTRREGDGVTVTQTFNNSSYALHGHLLEEIRRDASDRVFSDHKIAFDVRPIQDAAGSDILGDDACNDSRHPLLGPDSCNPTFSVVKQDTEIRAEGGAATKTRLIEDTAHDRFGNVLVSLDHGDDAIASDDIYARAEYRNDDRARWILGRPTRLEVRAGSDSGELLRLRTGDYNEQGQITAIHVDTGSGTATSVLAYDPFGNLSTLTTPPNARGQSQSYNIEYEAATGTYPARTTARFDEARNYESRAEYDVRFGVATLETDINNAQLRRTLDEFGRLVAVNGPYDVSEPGLVMDYHLDPSQKPRAVTTTNPGVPPGYVGPKPKSIQTVTIVDGNGQAIELRKSAVVEVDGNAVSGMITSGLVARDGVGRVVTAWQPFFTADASTGFVQPEAHNGTTMAYDSLDRTILTVYPGPEHAADITSFAIANDPDGRSLFLSQSLDPNGHVRETFVDHVGRTQAFVEHPSELESSITRYDYRATGELAKIVDAEGNESTLVYDRRGLRTALNNPDTGVIEDRYDLMGNRVALIEPNHRASGAEVHFEFDFDRLVKIDYPSKPDVTFEYGLPQAQFGRAGRLVKVNDETGTQEHFYGALGEITETRRVVEPAQPNQAPITFQLKMATDSVGRQLQITYPDGEVVTNTFDERGMLASVRGAGTGWSRTYVSGLRYDVFGNRVHARYGNDVETTWKFEPTRIRLDTVTTTLPSAVRIQDLHYQYDRGSNPTLIENQLGALSGGSGTRPGKSSLTLQYDGVDRLTVADGLADLTAQKTTGYHQTFAYTASHNIKRKARDHSITLPGGVQQIQKATTFSSDYAYAPARPHLPTRIGDLVITYDASGNPTQRSNTANASQQTLTWDDDNRLVDFSGGGVNQHNTYDADGNRVRRRSTQSETIFSSQYFDLENGTQGLSTSSPARHASHRSLRGSQAASTQLHLTSRVSPTSSTRIISSQPRS